MSVTTVNAGPVNIDWDIVPGEDESTLLDDLCELGDLNQGLPTYVIMRALSNVFMRGTSAVVLDAVQAEITRVARELVERGTRGA